jgi:hypothetical protein
MRKKLIVGLILVVLALCVGMTSASRTGPVFLNQGNVVCEDILPNLNCNMADTGSSSGTFTFPDGFDVTVNVDDPQNIIWNSNYPVDAAIVSGAVVTGAVNGQFSYVYDPAQTSDSGLKTPEGSALANLRFCYHQETPIPSPEFPTAALPLSMIIGFMGIILLIWRTKKN